MTVYKASDLEGVHLDAAVAKSEGMRFEYGPGGCYGTTAGTFGYMAYFQPSTYWLHGGPIIEREQITLACIRPGCWFAGHYMAKTSGTGDTPLMAAMRAYVAAKLGPEVDL